MLLQDAQDVGDLLTIIRAGAAPADHDALADIGRSQPDLEPVAHDNHLFPAGPRAIHPWSQRAGYGVLLCPRGDLNPHALLGH